ncbi:DctP family TRAP transporter solute-binding subunit [Algihabitans albus]|uniref:DctP family TRAP transporter solute-binding subunit n=1 Tax=Algihabitans albus TaxID=2164067 RepID=UPI000E5D18F9|nr:DctP family TRAP transporter solute-binding subunit [Algihabitans albus]
MSGLSKLLKTASIGAAALLAATAIAGGVSAQTSLKLGWTTSDGAKDPYAIAAREFAAALDRLAPGDFETQLFPNRQLGDEKEMLEGLSFGTLDVAIITNAVIANIEPAFQLNDMPFLYGDEAQAHDVLDGPVGQTLLAKLEDRGIVGLGFAEGGFRNMVNNAKPVSTPSDVEGVKYRVMQNPVFIEMFQSLGGNAVPMAWGEVFTAVQQGTIDGLEIPVAVVANNKFSEVTKYLSLTKHTYSALGVLISKKTYDDLSEAQQEAVREAAAMAIAAQREQNAVNMEELLSELRAQGMEVNQISDASAFRSKVTGVYDMFRDKIGAELMDEALAAVQ